MIHCDECRCRFGNSPQRLCHQVVNHSVHSFGGARLGHDSGPLGTLETEYNEASHFLYDLPQHVGHHKIREISPIPATSLEMRTDSKEHPLMDAKVK